MIENNSNSNSDSQKTKQSVWLCLTCIYKGWRLLIEFPLGLYLIHHNHVGLLILIIFIYFIDSHLYIEFLARKLWTYIEEEWNPQKLTAGLGMLDRLIYSMSYAFNGYSFIAVWLGLKIAQRLLKYRDAQSTNNVSKSEKDKLLREEGQKINAFLIGNIVSLILGLTLGVLLKLLFLKMQWIEPDDLNSFDQILTLT